MALDFRFPDVGEGITEGKLVKWLVREGDSVKKDRGICEVETDKAVVEIPSPEDGVILKLHVKAGDTIQVEQVIVTIGQKGEKVSEGSALHNQTEKQSSYASPAKSAPEVHPTHWVPSKSAAPMQTREKLMSELKISDSKTGIGKSAFAPVSVAVSDSVIAMPHTRKLARMLGVDIGKLRGTGPGGRVTDDDVRNFKEKKTPSISFTASHHGGETRESEHGFVETLPLTGLRKIIAVKLSESWHQNVHVAMMDECDVSDLVTLREKEKQRLAVHNVKLTFLPFIVKAAIVALNKYPIFNSEIDMEKEEIRVKHFFNIGIAVDTPVGLIVPVLKRADQKSITELAIEIQELARAARERKLPLDDISGSSFSITNFGSVGTRFATPIINPPNTAILGIGRIADRAVVKNGGIMIRKMIPLSFGFDHRVSDGAQAAEFMGELMRHLEDPELLLVNSL